MASIFETSPKLLSLTRIRGVLLLAGLSLLSACGSSGGDPAPVGPPPAANRAPIANAGADFVATEQALVQLNGSGSDPDAGDLLSFAWTQTGGPMVSIDNATLAQASFTSPNVAAGTPETLTFRITVTDAAGLSSTDEVSVTVQEIPVGPPPVANRAPIANAGADFVATEQITVQLNGSGSDPDAGDMLSFAWTQTGGPMVSIDNASMAQASFTSPNVAAGAPEVLTFRITVTDTAGLSSSDDVSVTVQENPVNVSVTGTVSFEFVPPVGAPNMCRGLDHNATVIRPIRRATVQLIDSLSGSVLASMPSSDDGDYSFTVAANTDVNLRVRAELKQAGNQTWDVEVRDNVVPGYDSNDPNAPPLSPLADRPLYVLEGSLFNTGAVDSSRDLLARTGWSGGNYTGIRAAAPFAVLDTILSSMLVISGVDANVDFPPLDVFWSPGNASTPGALTDADIAQGNLGGSFYVRRPPDIGSSLLLLGMAGDDTEEFDDHIIAHEWGHYFEDMLARSDNIGGQHTASNRLDVRVAFGEGFATALSGILLNSPTYCDTFGSGSGFEWDLEGIGGDVTSGGGWWDEVGIVRLIYDLWDDDDDSSDVSSIGFDPIYSVMRGPQTSTPAFTSIFSFTEALLQQGTGQNAFIEEQLTREDITAAGINLYATTETNDDGGRPDVLPLYTAVVPDGSIVNVCSNSQYDTNVSTVNAYPNKLSEHRFLRMTITEQRPYTFSVTTTTTTPYPNDPGNEQDQSDPDLYYYLDGQIRNLVINGDGQGTSGDENQEIFTTPVDLTPGDYVIDLYEFRYEDPDTPFDYPPRTCFDVSITPS